MYIVLEYADGGNLADHLDRVAGGRLAEHQARHWFDQIVRAVAYCHCRRVAHRDLKPSNVVLFRRRKVVKLADFGLAKRYAPGEGLKTSCGSIGYSAPEMFLGKSYDPPAVGRCAVA